MSGPRPRVTLKLATSLDGRIATPTGESRWITGDAARIAVHRLRSQHDAVLVGVDTALADDPELTVRLDDWSGAQPARVVLDSRQRLSPLSKLVRTARTTPTFVVTVDEPARDLVVPALGERPDLEATLQALGQAGLRSILVEGGGQVAASFLRCDLVDAVEWFRAPILLGGEGRPGVGALGRSRLADAPRLKRVSVEPVGDDLWERYERG
jgi:diaminohydroxyphosphoribosylaminopyrimidine deaminase/5-amino-6-(5-phosphoribosylamino)uracil reductase